MSRGSVVIPAVGTASFRAICVSFGQRDKPAPGSRFEGATLYLDAETDSYATALPLTDQGLGCLTDYTTKQGMRTDKCDLLCKECNGRVECEPPRGGEGPCYRHRMQQTGMPISPHPGSHWRPRSLIAPSLALSALQLLPGSLDAQEDAGDGCWVGELRLDSRGAAAEVPDPLGIRWRLGVFQVGLAYLVFGVPPKYA
jgi:hypothetical protein